MRGCAEGRRRKDKTGMSRWGVQLVIGKLVTDETFRQIFERRADETLATLRAQGIDLSESEVSAFLDTDPVVWASLAMRIDHRLKLVGARRQTNPAAPAHGVLTARERRVLRGVFEGLTNKQIASDLGITESAVKATIQHLFRKSRVRTRAQLVRIVIEGADPVVMPPS
jgi:DNA-binding NarL/FixJ family response regulator